MRLIAAAALAAVAGIAAVFFASCGSAPSATVRALRDIRHWNSASTVDASLLDPQDVPPREDPKVAALMYHNLVFGRTGNEYNRDLYNFEHDLAFLRKRFKIIDLDELLEVREGRLSLDSDAAVITFDDGDLSMYGIAYPLLREHDIKATFFIVTDFVGKIGYMNWAQIREMADYRSKAGERIFTFGSHGVSHPRMGELDAESLWRELVDSKAAIEQNTGHRVDFLALPFGSGAGDPGVAAAAAGAGYRGIRTSDSAAVLVDRLDPYRIPGIYIDNASTDAVAEKIWRMVGR
jgi:peptidoglycan/xylan/chitin deacetylase (PgdA/CDA1 family)